MDEKFKSSQKDAVKAAKDLGYGKEVMDKINAAKTEAEIQRIMITERHKCLD